MTSGYLGLLIFIIEVVTPPHPIPCPPTPPTMVRLAPGSYQRTHDLAAQVFLLCMSPEQRHHEEWTNLPENGGTFIRRLP